MFRKLAPAPDLPSWPARFGVRSFAQVRRDLALAMAHAGDDLSIGVGSAGLLRPWLSLTAYAGLLPSDGVAPIFNFFDRTAGGRRFRSVATRSAMRDHRGGRLSYDEHDGTDFVCPPGTPLVAAAPGVLVAYRDQWLRGGLTACVDHGNGLVTQYTHLSRRVAEPGQPLRRGDVVALSGHAGIDMTAFFPWVPPHVHFMVWLDGRPIDPYRAPGEPPGPGSWIRENDPLASGPLADDPPPISRSDVPIDRDLLDRTIAECSDQDVVEELAAAPSDAARLAIVEDSLHHQRASWPARCQGRALRGSDLRPTLRLTLPLSGELYRTAKPADTRFTLPR